MRLRRLLLGIGASITGALRFRKAITIIMIVCRLFAISFFCVSHDCLLGDNNQDRCNTQAQDGRFDDKMNSLALVTPMIKIAPRLIQYWAKISLICCLSVPVGWFFSRLSPGGRSSCVGGGHWWMLDERRPGRGVLADLCPCVGSEGLKRHWSVCSRHTHKLTAASPDGQAGHPCFLCLSVAQNRKSKNAGVYMLLHFELSNKQKKRRKEERREKKKTTTRRRGGGGGGGGNKPSKLFYVKLSNNPTNPTHSPLQFFLSERIAWI